MWEFFNRLEGHFVTNSNVAFWVASVRFGGTDCVAICLNDEA